jgi:TetR/AcrR family transcriptional regulator, cholesterol catabolism regulator
MTAISQKIKLDKPENKILPAGDPTRAEVRRGQVLSIASELFARKGFEATSMRDIATAAGLMSGSLYYHFASKEDLYVAVMDESIAKLFHAVERAIADVDDPWDRLEAAAVAHCEAMLDQSGFRVLTTPLFPPGLDPLVRTQLVEQRDRFERVMTVVIGALPLTAGIDPKILLYQYLGAITWIPVWYRPEGLFNPTQIARQFVQTMKDGVRLQ